MTRTVLPCRVPLYTHNVKYNRVKIVFSFQRLFFLFLFCSRWNRSERRLGLLRKVLTGFGLFSREPWNRRRRSRPRQEPRKNPKRQKANTLSLTSRERDRERVYKEIHKWNKIQQYTTNSLYSGGHSAISSGDHYRLAPSVVRVFCFDKRDDGRNKRTRRRTFAQLFSFPFSPPFFFKFRPSGGRSTPLAIDKRDSQNTEQRMAKVKTTGN